MGAVASCPECGRGFVVRKRQTKRCCGSIIHAKPIPKTVAETANAKRRAAIAHHFESTLPICEKCDCWVDRSCGTGCKLHPSKPCDTRAHRYAGGGCLDEDEPKFDSIFGGGGVGFVVCTWQATGGVETWHRTLIPRLKNVAGVVTLDSRIHAELGFDCAFGVGLQQAQVLAESVDTLVVWGAGKQLEAILSTAKNKPRVIAVSHCDDSSRWTTRFMQEQEPWTDQAVYLSPGGLGTIPESLRDGAIMIRNGADPMRAVPSKPRLQVRSDLKIDSDKRMLLAVARFSKEKRLHVLCRAMQYLPEYHLVIVGRGKTPYRKECESIMPQRVTMIDDVSHPGNLLGACDAVVSASEYEGYGLAMAEAMHAGRPLIATCKGFLQERPSIARIVPNDAGAREWAQIIDRDFGDPESQSERAITAGNYIGRYHSLDRFVREWRELTSKSRA